MTEKISIIGANGLFGKQLITELANHPVEITASDYCLMPDWFSEFSTLGHRWIELITGSLDVMRVATAQCTTIFYIPHQSLESQEMHLLEVQSKLLRDTYLLAKSLQTSHGAQKIIYVGSMLDKNSEKKSPLYYRSEIEQILRNANITVINLRSPVVVLPNSVPFDDVCTLVKNVPFLIFPPWMEKQVQPVYWKDLVEILVQLFLDKAYTKIHRNINIPGPDLISYRRFLQHVAKKLQRKKNVYLNSFLPMNILCIYLSLFMQKKYRRVKNWLLSWNQDAVTLVSDWKQKKSWVGVEDAIKNALHDQQIVKKSSREQKTERQHFVFRTVSVGQLKPKEVSLEFFYWMQNFFQNLIRIEHRDDVVRIYFPQKMFLLQEFHIKSETESNIHFECYFGAKNLKGPNNSLSIDVYTMKSQRFSFFSYKSSSEFSFIRKKIINILMEKFNQYLAS
jgi:uncharacterized protein YbjT (DUF2867 family)